MSYLYELETETEYAQHFQEIIDSGIVWRLEGKMGREAMNLIEQGICVLGKQSTVDYWGNYVPSRYEVEEGTKGSEQYAIDLGHPILT